MATKRRKVKSDEEGTTAVADSGVVWKEPTPRRMPTRIDWEPKLAELRDNPGEWGVIHESDTVNRVSSLAVQLRKRYEDYEFASRKTDDGGGELYGMYTG